MRKLMACLALLSILLLPGTVFAKDWPAQTNVPVDKVWTVTFNRELDPSSINNYSAYVVDNTGTRKTDCEVTLGPDNKSINIDSGWVGYHCYTNYTLHVSTAIKSIKEECLKQPIDMRFTTGSNDDYTRLHIGTVEKETINDDLSKTLSISLEDNHCQDFTIGDYTVVDGNFNDPLLKTSFAGKVIYFATYNYEPNLIMAIFTNKP